METAVTSGNIAEDVISMVDCEEKKEGYEKPLFDFNFCPLEGFI
ncbi:hypothetical protein [Thermococcus sp.]